MGGQKLNIVQARVVEEGVRGCVGVVCYRDDDDDNISGDMRTTEDRVRRGDGGDQRTVRERSEGEVVAWW